MGRVNWRSFEEARAFAQSLDLKSVTEWGHWYKTDARPNDIPSDPYAVYKNRGWKGWGDWLGTNRIANFNFQYRSFEEARSFVTRLNLKNQKEWRDWIKTSNKPDDIPSNPARTYRNRGWKGWGDWFGTGTVATFNRAYRSFEEARNFARQLHLQSGNEWKTWIKSGLKPDNIPVTPESTYKDNGWKGWGDWLGTGAVANQKRIFLSFEEARDFVHGLGLKSKNEWTVWAKTNEKPQDITADPSGVYKNKGWNSWGDWLGTGWDSCDF